MPSECAISTCSNNSRRTDKSISYYTFPKRTDIRKQWIVACKRADSYFNPENARVCSEHFCNEDFVRNLQAELLGYVPNRRCLKEGVVPHRNLPESSVNQYENNSPNCTESETPRQSRSEKREIRKRALCHINEITPKKKKLDFSANTESVQTSCNDCTRLKRKISEDESKLKTLLLRVKCLERQNIKLKKKS